MTLNQSEKKQAIISHSAQNNIIGKRDYFSKPVAMAVLASALVVSGCGKKGPLEPPPQPSNEKPTH